MADRNFLVAVVFGILLYSIAGIPPLAGFYSKLCILLCLLSNNYIVISVIIAIFSSVACFYYIRLVKILSFTSGRKSLFWIGDSTKHVEFMVALFVSVICLFLLRPSLLLNSATIAAISLM
jgi:NADH-quinone oxidoreductase subunit N